MPVTLRKGMTHPEVRTLTLRLAQLMPEFAGLFANPIDPQYFGNNVDAAVRKFQQSRGLVVDGIVGPNTWTALGVTSGAVQPAQPIGATTAGTRYTFFFPTNSAFFSGSVIANVSNLKSQLMRAGGGSLVDGVEAAAISKGTTFITLPPTFVPIPVTKYEVRASFRVKSNFNTENAVRDLVLNAVNQAGFVKRDGDIQLINEGDATTSAHVPGNGTGTGNSGDPKKEKTFADWLYENFGLTGIAGISATGVAILIVASVVVLTRD